MHVGNTNMSAEWSTEKKALTTVATAGTGAVSARVHDDKMVWMRAKGFVVIWLDKLKILVV